jgi:hypothetical protein
LSQRKLALRSRRDYILPMSKRVSPKPAAKQQPRWRISRIKASPAAEIGTVTAPDAETAIGKAIDERQIEKRHWPRLAARRIA